MVGIDGLQVVTVVVVVVGGVHRHLQVVVAHVREVVGWGDDHRRVGLVLVVVADAVDDVFRMGDVLERVFENLVWDCIIVIITT